MSACKVCMVGKSPSDPRIFHKESRTLLRAGYEVVMIAAHERDEVIGGIKVCSVPVPRNRVERLFFTPWRLFLRAIREKATIYQIAQIELIPQALLLRLLGKKIIYDVLEDTPNQIPYKKWVPHFCRRMLGWLVEKIEHFGARRFSAVVAAGVEIGERLGALNKHTVVVQNFPLLEEFPNPAVLEARRSGCKTVVSLGGIGPERAGQQIVKAMSLLPEGLGARLVLAGSVQSKTLLDELTRTAGWKHVEFRGTISRQEVYALMIDAAAALILYSPEPNHFDIRSTRLYESLGAALPVITSDFPKWRKLVEGNGFGLTVDPLDPQAIAEAIEYLLTHPAEAAEMGQRGREAVLEKYNWAREEPKLLQVYAELMEAKRSESLPGRTT